MADTYLKELISTYAKCGYIYGPLVNRTVRGKLHFNPYLGLPILDLAILVSETAKHLQKQPSSFSRDILPIYLRDLRYLTWFLNVHNRCVQRNNSVN